MSRLPALIPDDPTRVVTATEPVPAPSESRAAPAPAEIAPTPAPAAQTPLGRSQTPGVRRPAARATEDHTETDDEWSGATDVTTVRVPTEVLRLLRRRARGLGLPIGMIITAGLVEVLAAADEDLVERVETTQTRYDQARRRASRAT